MPPEPFPWDRKDCSRERKHERSESLGSVARWRDSSHHGSRELNRWSSVDFRRPIGHGKQGGWHFFSEESGNVYASSRSSVKILEDESCHPSMSRDGKYGRNSRENRGSYNQREWRGHSWEPSNGSPNTPGRAYDMSNEQKLRDNMPSYASHSNYDFGNTWDQIQMKDHQHDKIGSSNGLGMGPKCDRENSLGFNDWKPMKWVRSASLSSRGSGLSHLSSSKSLGATDSNEMKIESQTKTTTPVQSPSGDATACVTSAASSEDTASRKKPRLGWGEGLAKYEKKKVEVPDVKDGALFAISSMEPLHSLGSNHVDKSPRVMGFSDCASPATPSSVACSSSPGVEEKSFEKAISTDNDVTNVCCSPVPVSHNHVEGFSFSLEKLDCSLIANIGTSLAELLQTDDTNLTDTSFVRGTAMNKLLVLKGDISKALEVTESEIDSLETELKSLNSNTGGSSFRLTVSSSLPVDENVKSSEEKGALTNLVPRPAPLHIASPADTIGKIPTCNGDQEEVGTSIKDEDVDSPGTVTSKFVEPLSLAKSVSSSCLLYNTAMDLHPLKLTGTKVECSMPDPEVEKTGSSACGDCSMPLTEDENVARVSSDLSLCTDGEDMLRDSILASNKELANKACEVFNKLLPRQEHTVDIYGVGNTLSWQNVEMVKEKLARRKQFSKFKERVVTLKFKAYQHLWKEDTRLLSMRKYRAKSQKKFELMSRTMHNGYQKHRSSIRSRFSSPAGNLSLVPTEEIINFTKKLLLDSQVKLYRDTLKMPALILDKKEKIASRFFSNNGLVEDPCAVEKERAMINPWMPEEREIFMDKLATFGKDFRKISSFLDHKTIADCVEFYYKNHKSDSFKKAKKLDIGKQGKTFSTSTYLMTSGQRWNRERNAASLDILGEASIIASNADGRMRNRQGRLCLGGYSESKASWGDDGTVERSCSLEAFGSERETAAADVLAGICGSLSSEAMSSCITSSVDPAEGYLEWKCQKVDSVARQPLTPDVDVDDETCSDESCGEMDPTDWTDEEKSIFVQAVSSYGRDFVKISQCVRTRSRDQCKVFFSKARKCLGLDLMHPFSGNARASVGDDTNGSGSGSENACALEMGSGISGDKSGSKMDGDLPSVINHEESDHVETVNLNVQSAPSKSKERNDTEELDCKNVGTSDECQMGGHANLVSSGDNIVVNSADEKLEPLLIEETEGTLGRAVTARVNVVEHGFPVAESVSVCEGTDLEPANTESASGMKPLGEDSSDGLGNRIEVADEKSNASTTSQCGLQVTTHDSNLTMDASPLVADRNSCSGASQNPDFQQQVSHDLNSQERSCVISMHQETSLASANSVSQDSGAVPCEKSVNEDKMSSTLDCRDVSCHLSVSRDESCEMLTGLPLISNIEPSQVLRSYPLQVPAKKEMNGDVRCRNLSEVQSLLKSESSSNHFGTEDCFLRKCNSSKPPSLSAEFTPLSQQTEKTTDHLKVHSQNSSDSENSGRNGDVKLFGQILTTPSSLQRSSSGIHESEDKDGTHQHKSSHRSSNIKFTNHHNSDGNSALLKFDRNNHLGLENVPMRSYPYWDSSRLQTAYPSVTDSAILLAKYPAAFSNFPTPSKMEQQPLQAVVKSNDRTVNSVSVFPTREIANSNGVVDYNQVYRSLDATKVPPFTVDVKQRQDIYPEMQRRNGIEAMTSLQHQGRGMVGMNLVGRGGIIMSGPCNTGVSDPVAALKMHFAKTDQYGGQTTSMMREDESWRGNGDIGR